MLVDKMEIKLNRRNIGLFIIVISLIMFSINLSLTQTIINLHIEAHKSCPMSPEMCPYKGSVPIESVAGFVVIVAIGLFGLFLVLIPEKVEKTTEKKELKKIIKSLNEDEKKVYYTLVKADGFIFQSDLVKETGFSKVKVSRILDKLEAKRILERRRRGLANVVVLR
jgi:uncharacterized membrane protein